MARDAGPQGTGLIPPNDHPTVPPGSTAPVVPGPAEEPDDDDELQEPQGTPTPPGSGTPDTSVIDAPPPSEDDDDDDDDLDQGTQTPPGDLTDLMAQIEERMQRRFDRAITRMQRNLDRRQPAPPAPPAPQGETAPPAPATAPPAPAGSAPDVRAMRVLARDAISDAMESSGKAERQVVKSIVDEIVQVVDWSQIDDEDEFLEKLVTDLSKSATTLVNTGAARKVKQLRSAGLIPERTGQPGGGPAGQSGTAAVGTQMQRGQDAAKRRWPAGNRRLGG